MQYSSSKVNYLLNDYLNHLNNRESKNGASKNVDGKNSER